MTIRLYAREKFINKGCYCAMVTLYLYKYAAAFLCARNFRFKIVSQRIDEAVANVGSILFNFFKHPIRNIFVF